MTKKPVYRLTPDAQKDLIKIRRYSLAHWGIEQSQKYLLKLRQNLLLLSESPTMGKQRPEVALGVFSFPYASHVIYYKLDKKRLIVFAVLHKNMVPALHLDDRNSL